MAVRVGGQSDERRNIDSVYAKRERQQVVSETKNYRVEELEPVKAAGAVN